MKKISFETYNKKMQAIIDQDLPINEKLIAMLKEASKYKIIVSK